jgi:hypothetical protein
MEQLGQTTTVNARVLDALRAAAVSGELAPAHRRAVDRPEGGGGLDVDLGWTCPDR